VSGQRSLVALTTALACSPTPAHLAAVAVSLAHPAVSEVAMSDEEEFWVGSPVVLRGGQGEAVVASGSRLATLGATGATFWVGDVPRTIELPQVRVQGARWSADGATLFAGTGTIDVAAGLWSAHPAFADLVRRGPPGEGSMVIDSTSWSADGGHAATLLAWSGPSPSTGRRPGAQVVLLDLAGGAPPIPLPAEGASSVRIIDERVVVGTPVVRVWSFAGVEVGSLPAGPGAPLGISGGDGGGPLLLFHSDGSTLVVDAISWRIRARWAGHFLDAVAVPGGLIAADLEGRLHAGCIEAGGVREVGSAETGVRPPHLATTGDGRLAVMGSGVVHVMPFRLACGPHPRPT
jgi:hypothetical protein